MKKVKVTFPDGKQKDGELLEIVDQKEQWSEYRVEDGAILRLRQVVTQITKLEEKDASGNPIYVVNGQPVLTVIQESEQC
jgi:hypothetical protein